MQTIGNDQVVRTFDATHPPAARVAPGEVFVMETNDRFRDWKEDGEWPLDQLALMTGPVYIEGATPGQTLAVEVLDIQSLLGFGYVLAIPGFGLLEDRVEFRKRIVPIEGNQIRYSDTLSLPVDPNISRIGVAPAEGAQPSNTCGAFGGQLSNGDLGPGATLLLPIFVEGGLLSIEDVHARMGDGEATASAVEIAARVTLRCRVTEPLRLRQPVVLTREEVQTLGSGENAEAAARQALDAMAQLLVDHTDADPTEAAMLASVAADLRVSEMAGSPCHLRAAMQREILGL